MLEQRVAMRLGADVFVPASPSANGVVRLYAGWLIEHAGFPRAYGDPKGIAVSSKHAAVITNRGAGTTTELLAFARAIATAVYDAFGVELTPEPVFLGVAWPTHCSQAASDDAAP